jgi:glycosyltransferase involved in cell wall biosynthesis
MIKLSILILTHKRPELFKRCINSIIKNKPDNVEILVNNDSNDISESQHYTLFNEKSNNLSDLYYFLFKKSKGEYVYFLEDDDYITNSFFEHIDFSADLYYMNYMSHDIKLTLKRQKENFEQEKVNKNFQLSQILFKKKFVSVFPKDNSLDNDWKLYQNIKQNIKQKDGIINLIKDYMWIQTTDGKDNISFPEYNKDERWIH